MVGSVWEKCWLIILSVWENESYSLYKIMYILGILLYIHACIYTMHHRTGHFRVVMKFRGRGGVHSRK